jgi:hypothetical protein
VLIRPARRQTKARCRPRQTPLDDLKLEECVSSLSTPLQALLISKLFTYKLAFSASPPHFRRSLTAAPSLVVGWLRLAPILSETFAGTDITMGSQVGPLHAVRQVLTINSTAIKNPRAPILQQFRKNYFVVTVLL